MRSSQKLKLTLEPGTSKNAKLCFNPIYEKYPLKSPGLLEYYLVLSDSPRNSCPSCKLILLNDKVSETPEIIPDWIKNNAKWWSEGQIPDNDFLVGVQHLIKEKIIDIPDLPEQTSEQDEIPTWIRNSAAWWANGQISDDEFVNALKFLIERGILKV